MKFKKSIFSALATLFLVSPVFAELVFPSLSYRTGAMDLTVFLLLTDMKIILHL